MDQDTESCPCFPYSLERRAALKAALGLVLGLNFVHAAAAQEADPRNARPQEGDLLVFSDGGKKGEIITPADLNLGGPPAMAYPRDPGTGVVRDGSRLNKVLVVRLDPEKLAEETRHGSADGIVAYSAICTHEGCDVSAWLAETKRLKCVCHYAEFDPEDGARVLSGPAPRKLSRLPLKIVEGVLLAAGGFSGRVGHQRGGG